VLYLKSSILTAIAAFAFTHHPAQAGKTPKDTFAIVELNDTIVPIFKVRYCEDWEPFKIFPNIAVTDEGVILIDKDSAHVMAMDTMGKCLKVFERPRGTVLSMKCHSTTHEVELMILTSKTRATIYRSAYENIKWRTIRTVPVKNPSQMDKTYLSPKVYNVSFDQLRKLRPDIHTVNINEGLIFADSSLSIWRGVTFQCAYLIDHRKREIYRAEGIWQLESKCPLSETCYSITRFQGYAWLHQSHVSAAISRNRKHLIWAAIWDNELKVGRLKGPALSEFVCN